MAAPSPNSGSRPSRDPAAGCWRRATGCCSSVGLRVAAIEEIVVGRRPGRLHGPAHRPGHRARARTGPRRAGDRRLVARGRSRSAIAECAPDGALVVPVLDARRRELFAAAYRTEAGTLARGDRARGASRPRTWRPASPRWAGRSGCGGDGVAAGGAALRAATACARCPRARRGTGRGRRPWCAGRATGPGCRHGRSMPGCPTPRSTAARPRRARGPACAARRRRPRGAGRTGPARCATATFPRWSRSRPPARRRPGPARCFSPSSAATARSTSSRPAAGDVLGYVMVSRYADVWHILNVVRPRSAARPGHRRPPAGRAVPAGRRQASPRVHARGAGVERAAIHLYRRKGFLDHGIRPGYYSDNGEDAMIMWRSGGPDRGGAG